MAKDKAKVIFWSITGVIVAIGLFWGGKKVFGGSGQPVPEKDPNADKTDGGSGSGTTTTWKGDSFPLQKGSSGPNVKKLQQWLINKFGREATLPQWGADGKFGDETDTAVRDKIAPNGLVNEQLFDARVLANNFDGGESGAQPYDDFFRNVSQANSEFKNDLA